MVFRIILTIGCILGSLYVNQAYGQDDYSELEQRVKKAEQSGDWEEQLEAYMAIVDKLFWYETGHSSDELITKTKDYYAKITALCKKGNCGEKELLVKLYLADYYVYHYEDFKEMEEFVLPTIENYDFKNVLIKAHFYQIATSYFWTLQKSLKKAHDYGLKAEKIYEKQFPLHRGIYYSYMFLSNSYLWNSSDSSIYYADKAIVYVKKVKETNLELFPYEIQARYYSNNGDISKAIKKRLEVVKLAKQIEAPEIELYYHEMHLAKDYTKNREYSKALEIVQDVMNRLGKKQDIELSSGDISSTKSYAYETLAKIQGGKGQYSEAIMSLDSVIVYTPKDISPQAYFLSRSLKTLYLVKLKKYQEAEKLSLTLFQEMKANNFQNYHVMSLFSTAIYRLYLVPNRRPSQQHINELALFFEDLLSHQENKYTDESSSIYRLITLLSIYQGDFKSSKTYLETCLNVLDSVYEQKNSRLSKELLVQYQTKEKEQQLEYQALELSQKTTQRNILIIAALLLLGLGWYFWQLSQRLKISKQTIEAQTGELEQLYKSKNRFFANIAHELRTPLTLITGPVAHIVQDQNLPIATRQRLNTVYRNTTYLKQLVNQILDLSKKETGDLSLQVQKFQFSDLLITLVTDFQPFADYQQVEFITPTMDYGIELTTDGEKLFIILKNLLSNAFKYTPSGGQVVLSVIDLGDDLQISVQDSGRGIAEADLPKIFNRYFQTSQIDAPIEGGTGIGLAVTKEYIESLGGSIQVNSKLGKGSTFVVMFPKSLQVDTPFSKESLSFLSKNNIIIKSAEDKKITKTIEPTYQKTILIVEDNVDISQHLQVLLEEQYQLILASNGVEALKRLEENTPDLILTDLMMPMMDGFELVKKLKASEEWHDIPIITLTARSEMTDKLTALRIGIDDYLVKPFHEEELSLRIQHLLDNRQKRQAFLQEETQQANVHSDSEPISSSTPIVLAEDAKWLVELEALVKSRIGYVDFNVNQLCEELSISTSTLYRNVKRLTGLSPKEYINQIRYTTARKLLEDNTYQSVKRVAYEVGFKDEKNFARNFKKRFGKYPSEYGI